MKAKEWKVFTIGLIDGLERSLRGSTRKMARVQLAVVREHASKAVTSQARKLCDRRLDKLVEQAVL